MTGALLIKAGKEFFIEGIKPDTWYNSRSEFDDVLVTGPLLVEERKPVSLPITSLVSTRHPRSAAGSRNSKKVILLTLDGRTGEAAGMTLTELAELMMLLRCRDAVNLDGGGSTTMWIRGKPFNGVVNMPCDNKKFDHLGERAVSDILVIR
jgi:exopolysaccharide biosynthesis protein